MCRYAEPSAVNIVFAFDHLLGVGPADGVCGADGRFVSGTDPVYMVTRLLPVDAFLKNSGSLTDFQNINNRIGIEKIFASTHRSTRHIGGDFHNGFHLCGFLEGSGIDRIATLIDVISLLLTANRFGGHRFRNQCRSRQIALMTKTLNVRSACIGDYLHIGVIHRTDKTVKTVDQIAACLIEGTLGKVLQQRIETFGSSKRELILGDG